MVSSRFCIFINRSAGLQRPATKLVEPDWAGRPIHSNRTHMPLRNTAARHGACSNGGHRAWLIKSQIIKLIAYEPSQARTELTMQPDSGVAIGELARIHR